MSKTESIFDSVLKNDENMKRWKNQIIEEENLIQTMQNALEVEQAKETLLLREMKGKILQVDQLASRSSQQANDQLQNLIVDQLMEIDKSEILAKVNEENYRQCAIALREISKWKPTLPELLVAGSHREEKQPETRFPGRNKRNTDDEQVTDESKRDEEMIIEKDIMKIHEEIVDAEKEHEILKEFLSEHQKVLEEMESRVNRSQDGRFSILHEAKGQKPPDARVTEFDLTEDENPAVPLIAPSTSTTKVTILNRTFEAKTAILSKRGVEAKIGYLKQGFSQDGIEDLPKPQRLEPSKKKVKFNLYDTTETTQQVTAPTKDLQAFASKSNAFKLKTPSTLRNRIK